MKALFSVLSPAGGQARLQVLIFHRVLAQPDPLFPEEPDVQRFEQLCEWFKRHLNVLDLSEALHRLETNSLPVRAAAITFDDGYADNLTLATPILKRHGLTATFFVATGYLNGGRMWNDTVVEAVRQAPGERLSLRGLALDAGDELDISGTAQRRRALSVLLPRLKYLPTRVRQAKADALAHAAGARLPQDLMMTSDQVQQLRREGMAIGGHTVLHPILARLDDSTALQEMAEGREVLQGLIHESVTLFAYPNGKPGDDYLPRDVDLVRKAGFSGAVSTAWGAASRRTSRFEVPRFTPWDRGPWRFGLRMARNLVSKSSA